MYQRLFKKDLEDPVKAIIQEQVPKLIKAAVLRGQIELLEHLSKDALTSKRAYLHEIQYFLRKQLEHITTTEHTPLTADEMHPRIDDTPENWDE